MGLGPYLTNYRAAGAESGAWGWPIGEAECRLRDGGCKMPFQNGTGFYSPEVASNLVPRGFDELYELLGSERSRFGYPKTVAVAGPSQGYVQDFQGGTIAYSPATRLVEVSGDTLATWRAAGGVNSRYGYPMTAMKSVLANGGGFVQEFTAGTVWSSSAGAFAMGFGPYRTNYVASGGAAGRWGWPTGDADCTLAGRGCSMSFQKGVALYSPSTGSDLVSAEVAKAWTAFGGAGVLGYPAKAQSSVSANGGGFVQEFTAGTVWSSSAGAFAMGFGPYRTNYVASGGAAGRWGWPTGDADCTLAGRGCSMSFQKGVALYSPSTGSDLVSAEVAKAWTAFGGAGVLGYPAKAQSSVSANGGGFVQEFTAGTVWSSSAGAFAMGFGPYRTNYVASGGAAGRWGWPAGEATCRLANGGCTMAFQTGVVAYSSGTASHLIPSGAILIEWMKRGGTSSTLGYPIAEAVTSNGLRSQRFEGGQIVLNTVTGTVTIR
ncbi:LGFP repeat-containing protein [Microbacterium sp. W4I4]|uniref:LGFP repeat-containing protein n=1 Tax=Microbacterium sp. W4I4 TaxID=3042295 RepID=UPI0027D8ADE0|nr:hypothetical protein [Microbacterium sp. W4I4]